MDKCRRQLLGAVIKVLEDDGKRKLSEMLNILEETWGERLFAEYASDIVDIWQQRQQLRTLRIDSHVSQLMSPACISFPTRNSDKY